MAVDLQCGGGAIRKMFTFSHSLAQDVSSGGTAFNKKPSSSVRVRPLHHPKLRLCSGGTGGSGSRGGGVWGKRGQGVRMREQKVLRLG